MPDDKDNKANPGTFSKPQGASRSEPAPGQAGTGEKDFSDAEERKRMKNEPVQTETPYAEHAGQDEGAEHEEEEVE